jgi:hypothetical protein
MSPGMRHKRTAHHLNLKLLHDLKFSIMLQCKNPGLNVFYILHPNSYLRIVTPPHLLISSGSRLTVLVKVWVVVVFCVVTAVVVVILSGVPDVIRHEQADEMAGGPPGRFNEMFTWRFFTGSSLGQAAS